MKNVKISNGISIIFARQVRVKNERENRRCGRVDGATLYLLSRAIRAGEQIIVCVCGRKKISNVISTRARARVAQRLLNVLLLLNFFFILLLLL